MNKQAAIKKLKNEAYHIEIEGKFYFVDGLGDLLPNDFEGLVKVQQKRQLNQYLTWIDLKDGLRNWRFIQRIQ